MEAEPTLRAALIEIVGSSVMRRDAIVEELIARGAVTGSAATVRKTVDAALQLDTSFSDGADGVVHVPTLLEGTSWTVWIDAIDASDGFVRGEPHLGPFTWWLIAGDVDMIDESGQRIGPIETDGVMLGGVDTDVIRVPDGSLDGLADGWATVSVTSGSLRWTRCAEPPEPHERIAAAIRAGFARRADVNIGVDVPSGLRFAVSESVVLEALMVDREAFVEHPVAPLPELFRAAGLEVRRQVVVEAGFDWDAYDAWTLGNRVRLDYDLSSAQVEQLSFAVGALAAHVADETEGLGADADARQLVARRVAATLDDADVALAFWETSLDGDTELPALASFAMAVADEVQDTPTPGPGWLLARALDWSGDAALADRLLTDLLPGAAGHALVLEDAAGFAADRGDAVTAFRLLSAAGVEPPAFDDDDDEFDADPDPAQMLLLEIAGWATHRPRETARRNDPCPCGSGRKYKACHLGREGFPLADRAVWLYDKAKRFMRARGADTAMALAELLADDDDQLYDELLESELVSDLVLHEGDWFDEFLDSRSELLPDDEAVLAAQWLLAERSVFEVVGIGKEQLELRDIGSGERLMVVNVTPNHQTRIGATVVARPLPVGDTYRALGGVVPISATWITPFLDAIASEDPEELVATYAALFRPPGSESLADVDG
ncbi:MAG: hypothetical protein JWN62_1664 [Acidimicrobiales bacterium]|nr:hypothetical protein [Acidimicrobiales bacterium]